MNTSAKAQDVVGLSTGANQVLASSLTTLGRFHNDEYVLNRDCLESVKDIIRFLRKDNEAHEIRTYLGQAKVVQNDLIHIIKACSQDSENLFDLTIRLLVNLTNPVTLLYGEEIPEEKVGRNIYMTLIECSQEHKEAFADIDFWKVISGKLTDFFEIDWAERSEDQCLQIEKMLLLLRNVLHIPADLEKEKITENDISVHDKILWSLRQSQILEFLLYVSSNSNEQRYYLLLLDIFSLILREQNPKLLAMSEVQNSAHERIKDVTDLLALREKEKASKRKYSTLRTFDSTVVLKDLKSFSGREVIYHGSLEDMKESLVTKDKKRRKPRNYRVPVQSEPIERRSSFSVRLFLKEFCIEFLNCSYNNLMSVIKEKLVAGKALPNDDTYYFWALHFFLEFICASNMNIKLISETVTVQNFHFLQTNMDENFEKLVTEKKKTGLWIRKLHLILKAYYSLLQTLKWMDTSKAASVREFSDVLKSQIFYIAEYREMSLSFITKYDSDIFCLPYLRDVVEASHLALKLLEIYTKKNKIVVQKKIHRRPKKKKNSKRKPPPKPIYEANEDIWERIKDDAYRRLTCGEDFPEIPPFDVLLELSDEEQKKKAMKDIQKFLHEGNVADGIGLLRSARQVWPENDHFGSDGMSPEDEVMALQEICIAELGNERVARRQASEGEREESDSEDGGESVDGSDEGADSSYNVSEKHFDLMDYKKLFVNKRVVEACSILLKNYSKNSDYTNHCVIKILFRIGWECRAPCMMYQASLFWTLLTIMNDKHRKYGEINDFAVHLFRKFTEAAQADHSLFAELLFWKDPSVAFYIQGDIPRNADDVGKRGRRAACWSFEQENELQRLWEECNPDLPVKKKIDWIKGNLIDESKSARAVGLKLKEMGLISDSGRPPARCKAGKEWTDEEVEELTRFFNEFRSAVDVVSVISDHLTLRRTKTSIKEKLLELELVSSAAELRKKNGRRKPQKATTDDDEENESSDVGDEEVPAPGSFKLVVDDVKEALEKAQHLKEELTWLRDNYEELIDDSDDDDSDDEGDTNFHPLIPLQPSEFAALEKKEILQVLQKLGADPPGFGRICWKLPGTNKADMKLVLNLMNDFIGENLTENGSQEIEEEMSNATPPRKERVNSSGKPKNEKEILTDPYEDSFPLESVVSGKKVESDSSDELNEESDAEVPQTPVYLRNDTGKSSKTAVDSESSDDVDGVPMDRSIDPSSSTDEDVIPRSGRSQRATIASQNFDKFRRARSHLKKNKQTGVLGPGPKTKQKKKPHGRSITTDGEGASREGKPFGVVSSDEEDGKSATGPGKSFPRRSVRRLESDESGDEEDPHSRLSSKRIRCIGSDSESGSNDGFVSQASNLTNKRPRRMGSDSDS